jgi:hypothetical protein
LQLNHPEFLFADLPWAGRYDFLGGLTNGGKGAKWKAASSPPDQREAGNVRYPFLCGAHEPGNLASQRHPQFVGRIRLTRAVFQPGFS